MKQSNLKLFVKPIWSNKCNQDLIICLSKVNSLLESESEMEGKLIPMQSTVVIVSRYRSAKVECYRGNASDISLALMVFILDVVSK